ncbi:MAG: hypothetical protein IJB57_04950 [Clostridia bacterium]|nr:hypothetical protein [Clostridia bacterium]
MQASLCTAPDLEGKDLVPRKTTKVCFVCTGNTCRSPMAAAVYNHLNYGSDRYAVSMGLYAHTGMPISENAAKALEANGVICDRDNPYLDHKASSCNEDILCGCDYIVGISEAHTLELIARYPELASKIYSMPKGISDPWGGDLETYKACLCEITEGVKELFSLDDRNC